MEDEIKIVRINYSTIDVVKAGLTLFTTMQLAKILNSCGRTIGIAIKKNPENDCFNLVFDTDAHSDTEMRNLVRAANTKIERLLKLKADLELIGMKIE